MNLCDERHHFLLQKNPYLFIAPIMMKWKLALSVCMYTLALEDAFCHCTHGICLLSIRVAAAAPQEFHLVVDQVTLYISKQQNHQQ
jgi:hypothetical protein